MTKIIRLLPNRHIHPKPVKPAPSRTLANASALAAERERRHIAGYAPGNGGPAPGPGHNVMVMTSDSDPAGPPAEEPAPPAVPVSAGALIFDRAGRLLILKPTYKSGWTIPGGVMESDGETPWEACQREVREECGLDVREGQLAAVDFRRPRPGRPGGIRFLFDCGVIDRKSLAGIAVQPEEVAAYRLAALPDAFSLLRGPIRRRVRAATAGRGVAFLEDGRPVPGVGARR